MAYWIARHHYYKAQGRKAQLVMQNFMLERLLERIRFLLEDSSISVLAYNFETILAEKLETVISRADQNTRPRDYYDIYILAKLQYSNIEPNLLKAALKAITQNCEKFHYADSPYSFMQTGTQRKIVNIADECPAYDYSDHF